MGAASARQGQAERHEREHTINHGVNFDVEVIKKQVDMRGNRL
jgi:hypothetical protein